MCVCVCVCVRARIWKWYNASIIYIREWWVAWWSWGWTWTAPGRPRSSLPVPETETPEWGHPCSGRRGQTGWDCRGYPQAEDAEELHTKYTMQSTTVTVTTTLHVLQCPPKLSPHPSQYPPFFSSTVHVDMAWSVCFLLYALNTWIYKP